MVEFVTAPYGGELLLPLALGNPNEVCVGSSITSCMFFVFSWQFMIGRFVCHNP